MGDSKSTPSVPKGYIAASPYSLIVAVDSKSLSENGEVHMPTFVKLADIPFNNSKEIRPLDAFAEMTIKGDPRLEALKAKAKTYGQKYANQTSPDYIVNIHQREKQITALVVADIGNTYGPYSDDTQRKGFNSAEFSAVMPKNLRDVLEPVETVQLKDTQKNDLVCRHYAPIASVLLHEAGVPNHMVVSYIRVVKGEKNGRVALDKDYQGTSGHVYVITDQGNAIVEATVAGDQAAESRAYKPIVNGVTVQDIIYKGKTAIPLIQEGKRVFAYGGHNGDGYAQATQGLVNAAGHLLLADTEAPIRKSIEEYNRSLPDSFITNPSLSQSAKGIDGKNSGAGFAKLGIPKINLDEFIAVPSTAAEDMVALVHKIKPSAVLPQPAKEQTGHKTPGGK